MHAGGPSSVFVCALSTLNHTLLSLPSSHLSTLSFSCSCLRTPYSRCSTHSKFCWQLVLLTIHGSSEEPSRGIVSLARPCFVSSLCLGSCK